MLVIATRSARTGPEVEHARRVLGPITLRQVLEHRVHEQFGLGPRDQHAAIHGEFGDIGNVHPSWRSIIALVYLISIGSLAGVSAYAWLLAVAPISLLGTTPSCSR